MPAMIRYTCRPEVLPMVEGALAANGYCIERPRAPNHDAAMLLMVRGRTVVRLQTLFSGDHAVIELWGQDEAATRHLLESLPLALEQQCSTEEEAGDGAHPDR